MDDRCPDSGSDGEWDAVAATVELPRQGSVDSRFSRSASAGCELGLGQRSSSKANIASVGEAPLREPLIAGDSAAAARDTRAKAAATPPHAPRCDITTPSPTGRPARTSPGSNPAVPSTLASPGPPKKDWLLAAAAAEKAACVAADAAGIAAYEGTLEVELLGTSGFYLHADTYMPREMWNSICKWPGAKNAGKSRWQFPAQQYSNIAQRLETAGATSRCPLPPLWVLAALSVFQQHGFAQVRKKAAQAIRADAPARALPKEVRSRDGDLTLLPYQREGVAFGLRRGGRILFGDEMGLGKTAQALVLMSQYPEDFPLLVICPSSLRSTWREEAARWVPGSLLPDPEHDIQLIRKGNDVFREGAKVFVVSYDLLAQNAHFCATHQGHAFRMVICDESHYLKSASSQRSKCVGPLLHKTRRCVLLSGTPSLSCAAEVFTQLDCLLPGLLPPSEEFCARYCEEKVIKIGRRELKKWVGSRLGYELQALLESTVMIRRCKADVLSQLPEKRRQRVFLERPKNSAEMKTLSSKLRDFEAPASFEDGAPVPTSAMELFQLTSQVKVKPVQEYVEYLVQADCRFLLFAHHMAMMDALQQTLEKQRAKFIRIDGSTASHKREEYVDRFRGDSSVQVALLSITACATGLNLQCCSTVVFAELHWTPGVLLQAESRVHRIGQRHFVNVHYLIAPGTLDESMYAMLDRKQQDMGVLLDGRASSIGARQAQGHVGAFSTSGGAQVDLCPGALGGVGVVPERGVGGVSESSRGCKRTASGSPLGSDPKSCVLAVSEGCAEGGPHSVHEKLAVGQQQEQQRRLIGEGSLGGQGSYSTEQNAGSAGVQHADWSDVAIEIVDTVVDIT